MELVKKIKPKSEKKKIEVDSGGQVKNTIFMPRDPRHGGRLSLWRTQPLLERARFIIAAPVRTERVKMQGQRGVKRCFMLPFELSQ
jgi:hypothetical protein